MNHSNSVKNLTGWVVILTFLGAGFWYAISREEQKVLGGHGHGHGSHEGHEHEDEKVIEISEVALELAEIEIDQVQEQKIRKSITLLGTVEPNSEQSVSVRPKLPGLLVEVQAKLGDKIRRGSLLATVEANGSLTHYSIRSPISGTVVDKDAFPGEFVPENKQIFSIINLNSVWIDFLVPEQFMNSVKQGDMLMITSDQSNKRMNGKIAYVSRAISPVSQAALARVVIDNRRVGLIPGELVRAIHTSEISGKSLAVRNTALQYLDKQPVVFVQDGKEEFSPRSVVIDIRGREFLSIKSGLKKGEKYVTLNSFILKAEFLKSLAGHQH